MQNVISFFQTLSPLKRLLQYIFKRIIGDYFISDLDINFFLKHLSFLDTLAFNTCKFNESILKNSTFSLKHGILRRLLIKIPWTNLLTKSIEITVDEIFITLESKAFISETKRSELEKSDRYEDIPKSDVFKRIVKKIFDNLKVSFKKIMILYLGNDGKNGVLFEFHQAAISEHNLLGETGKKLIKIDNVSLNLIENLMEDLYLEKNKRIVYLAEEIEIDFDKNHKQISFSFKKQTILLDQKDITFLYVFFTKNVGDFTKDDPEDCDFLLEDLEDQFKDDKILQKEPILTSIHLDEVNAIRDDVLIRSQKTEIMELDTENDLFVSIIDDFFLSLSQKNLEESKDNEEFDVEDKKMLDEILMKEFIKSNKSDPNFNNIKSNIILNNNNIINNSDNNNNNDINVNDNNNSANVNIKDNINNNNNAYGFHITMNQNYLILSTLALENKDFTNIPWSIPGFIISIKDATIIITQPSIISQVKSFNLYHNLLQNINSNPKKTHSDNNSDDSFYSLDREISDNETPHYCSISLIRFEKNLKQTKNEDFFTMKKTQPNIELRTHYFLKRKFFSNQPKELFSLKKKAITIEMNRKSSEIFIDFSPVIINLQKKTLDEVISFTKSLSLPTVLTTNSPKKTLNQHKTCKISIFMPILRITLLLAKENWPCYCKRKVIEFQEEGGVVIIEALNVKLRISDKNKFFGDFLEVFLLTPSKNEYRISKILTIEKNLPDKSAFQIKFTNKNTEPSLFVTLDSLNTQETKFWTKLTANFTMKMRLGQIKIYFNMNLKERICNLLKNSEIFRNLPNNSNSNIESVIGDTEDEAINCQINNEKSYLFDFFIDKIIFFLFEFDEAAESNSEHFLHNKFNEKLKTESILMEFSNNQLSLTNFIKSSIFFDISSKYFNIIIPNSYSETFFKSFEETYHFPYFHIIRTLPKIENDADTIILSISIIVTSHENIEKPVKKSTHDSFEVNSPGLLSEKQSVLSSQLIEEEEDINNDENYCKFSEKVQKVMIKCSFEDIIISPCIGLLLEEDPLKEISSKLYNKTDKKDDKINEISLEISFKSLFIDIFPIKSSKKLERLEFQDSRSLISIQKGRVSYSNLETALEIQDFKFFFLNFTNKISIETKVLPLFLDLDGQNFHMFYGSQLEHIGFKPFFEIKNIFMNEKTLSIKEILMTICKDTPLYLRNHLNLLLPCFELFFNANKIKETQNNINPKEEFLFFKQNENKTNNLLNKTLPDPQKTRNLKIESFILYLYSGIDFSIITELTLPHTKSKHLSSPNLIQDYFKLNPFQSIREISKKSITNTRNHSKYCQIHLKNLEINFFDNFDSFFLNLKSIKLLDFLNPSNKKQIFGVFSKKNPFLTINGESLKDSNQSLYIKIASLYLNLNPGVLDFLNGFLNEIIGSTTSSTIIENEEKMSFKTFSMDSFKVVINYEPLYQNLTLVMENPMHFINIGPINGLELKFKRILLEDWETQEVLGYCMEVWGYDIRANQKGDIIKRLPYINNVVGVMEKVIEKVGKIRKTMLFGLGRDK